MTSNTKTRRSDRGLTLIELLITVSIIGTIGLVTTTALVVILRQQADTQARLDVARWEQSLATWLPTDLTSASGVDADPAAVQPGCSGPVCTDGLNALLVTWDDGGQTVSVSYRYGPSGDGESFQLTRVACNGSSCSSIVVLRDLDGPRGSDGQLIEWSTVTEVPDSIIDVTVPLDVTATADDGASGDPDGGYDSPARRVIVEVNGLPDPDGETRSSRVSITAGGDNRSEVEPPTFEGVDFTEVSSGCGGPTTLVLDTSGSVNANIDDVEDGVVAFVQAFDGTPTDLEVVEFNTQSETWSAVDPATGNTIRRFDLTNPDHVELLIGPSGTSGLANSLSAGGGTNWEDALHRVFYTDAGEPKFTQPNLLVFFTDGEPTFGRTSNRPGFDTNSADASPVGPPSIQIPYNYLNPSGGTTEGASFNPTGWFRANYIIRQFSSTRAIGVGVGDAFFRNTSFSGNPRSNGWPRNVPNEAFLGKLIAGGLPHTYDAGSPGYVKRTYSGSSWGDVETADLLVTSTWSALGTGLREIALVDCGGTLTIQTRDQSGAPADGDVTYEIGGERATTSRIKRSDTADVALEEGTAVQVEVIPTDLGGFTPQSWRCRAGGSDMTFGSEYELIDASDVAAGVLVTVAANEAVSCTLTVS